MTHLATTFYPVMPNTRVILAALLVAAPHPSRAQSPARIPDADRVRIAEAFRLAGALGDSVWAGWHAAPFAVLLVTPDAEFLVGHPHPSAQFASVGYDSLLGSEVFTRARVFAPTMQATFPADGGVPTIVIGDAERTGKRSTAWVLTLLHEHFHQLQSSRPGYFAQTAALGLAHGDETGMWMLNYAFPYDTARVRTAVATLGRAALEAAHARGARRRRAALRRYLDARRDLRATLSADDYRYLAFQLWQEGVARYTELAMARLAARAYTPTAAFRALPDYDDFSVAAAERATEIDHAAAIDLGSERRTAFYPLGAATALLLDETVPRWRDGYFVHPFDLDALFDGAEGGRRHGDARAVEPAEGLRCTFSRTGGRRKVILRSAMHGGRTGLGGCIAATVPPCRLSCIVHLGITFRLPPVRLRVHRASRHRPPAPRPPRSATETDRAARAYGCRPHPE